MEAGARLAFSNYSERQRTAMLLRLLSNMAEKNGTASQSANTLHYMTQQNYPLSTGRRSACGIT